MLLIVDHATVDAVWTAVCISDPPTWMRRCQSAVDEIVRETAKMGYVNLLEAETVIRASGLDVPIHDTEALLGVFGVPQQFVYPRPRSRVKALWGTPMIAAVDMARLMIVLERMGLPIDPAPLCDALRPALKAKAFLTSPEIAIYWHPSERGRGESVEVAIGSEMTWCKPSEKRVTATGYRASLFRDGDGRPKAVEIEPPRRMRAASMPFLAMKPSSARAFSPPSKVG